MTVSNGQDLSTRLWDTAPSVPLGAVAGQS